MGYESPRPRNVVDAMKHSDRRALSAMGRAGGRANAGKRRAKHEEQEFEDDVYTQIANERLEREAERTEHDPLPYYS